jgi:phenylpropionate dioxygenase-like ring-hydroxylating dioxygenase large terminal subunit
MGNLLRRFWFPALLEEEVAVSGGAPVRLRLLGENLVAFRDTRGRVGIVDAYCAHRRAGLFFGRNEEGGLRCVYHGWKFDVDGNCIDMPSEPQDTNYKERVKTAAYPTAVRGGAVWVYMGPKEVIPELPDFEWSRLPKAQRTVTKRLLRSNWSRAVEGGIDSSHISFLHSSTDKDASNKLPTTTAKYARMDRHPVFDVNEAEHGLLITARRNAEPGNYYWRITQFLLPFYTMIPPSGDFTESSRAPYDGHAWVPIDDDHTWTWSFSANPHVPYSEEERDFHGGPNGLWGPIDGHYHPLLNITNDFRIDREKQGTHNFTGIDGIPNQDAAVLESMEPDLDWSREHLGHSDLAIVKFRRLLQRLAKELMEGRSPRAAANGALYNVRSASVVLPDTVPVAEGAAKLLQGGARE